MDERKKHRTETSGKQQARPAQRVRTVLKNVPTSVNLTQVKQQKKLKTKKTVLKNKPTHPQVIKRQHVPHEPQSLTIHHPPLI
jgi:hypothetical protein